MSARSPTLLIADDSSVESLRKAGVLPAEWLDEEAGGNLLSRSTFENALGIADSVKRAQWFHRHVQDAEQVIWLNVYRPSENLQSIDKTIEEFEKWHEMRKKELGYLDPQVDEAWVVVLTEEPPQEWKESLGKLFSAKRAEERLGPDGPIYLMGDKLNYLQGDICHSTNVWPLAVSNLLLSLVAKGENRQRKSSGIYAWRTFGFLPMEESALSNECEKIITDIQRKLEDPSQREEEVGNLVTDLSPTWSLPRKTTLKGPDLENLGEPLAWQKCKPRIDLATVMRDEDWAAEARQKGEEENASSDVNDLSEPPSILAVTSCWRAVHTSSGVLGAALGNQSFVEKADFSSKEGEQARLADKIMTLHCRRRDLESDSSECASELVKAQKAFLSFGIRLGLAFAVMSFIVFVVWSLFIDVFGNWSLAFVAFLATAMGVFAASIVPWHLQRKAGQHSVEKYREKVIQKIRDNRNKVHVGSLELVGTGIEFHNNTVNRMTTIRLRELFERLNILFHEGFSTARQPQSFDGGVSDIRKQSDGGSAKETKVYSDYTYCYLNNEGKPLTTEQKKEIIDSQSLDFSSKWVKFAQENDTNSQGHLPIAKLEEFISERRRCIELAVAQESIGSGEMNDQKIMGIINERIKEKDNEKFTNLLSVVTPEVGGHQGNLFSEHDGDTSERAKKAMRAARVLGMQLDEFEISPLVLENWFNGRGEEVASQ